MATNSTDGMNATFSDPISIANIKSFFGSGVNDLAGTFSIQGVNIYGFNDLDSTGSPYTMAEWRRYDHHRASLNTVNWSINQNNLDFFNNPLSFTLNVRNNAFGRAFTFEADVYLNIGANSIIGSTSIVISTTVVGNCQAGTANGGTGNGSIPIEFSPFSQYLNNKAESVSIQQDTQYTLIVVIKNVSNYSYTYNGENRTSSCKNNTEGETIYTTFTTGHPKTPADIYISILLSDITIFETSTMSGAIFPFKAYNRGENPGSKTIHVKVQDSLSAPQNIKTNSITVTVEGKIRGQEDPYVSTSVDAGYLVSKWEPGQTLYCYYSLTGSTWTYIGSKVVGDIDF